MEQKSADYQNSQEVALSITHEEASNAMKNTEKTSETAVVTNDNQEYEVTLKTWIVVTVRDALKLEKEEY